MQGFDSYVRYHTSVRGNQEAIVYRDQRLTWRDVDEAVNRLAWGMLEKGVKHGDRVGVLLKNCTEFPLITLACSRIGAIFLPLNIRLTAFETETLVKDADCSLLISETDFQEITQAVSKAVGQEWFMVEDIWDEIATDEPRELPEVEWSDPLFLCYTSGTTGNPKGVLLTHNNLKATMRCQFLAYGRSFEDRQLINFPLAFTGGIVGNALPALGSGATLVLEREYSPSSLLDLLVEEKISIFFAVTVIFEQLAALPEFETADLSNLRVMATGGAPVPESLLKYYAERAVPITETYGLTEGSALCGFLPLTSVIEKRGSAGKAVYGVELRIIDQDGNELPPGEVGEILVKGEHVMRGYWRNEEATRQAIDADGWLHTRDMGSIDSDGYLYVSGRKDDMYISGGLNVHPAETEEVLSAHSQIAEAAIVGVPDDKWGQVGHVFVVKSGDLTEEEVVAYCRDRVADYKVPRHVTFLDQLPRNMSGKVVKRDLPV